MIAFADYTPILERFEALRPLPGGRRWYARCPVHGDRRPSLALWVASSGCLCAKCMSNKGCGWKDIVKAVGTREQDWFPPKEGRKMSEGPRPQLVARYEYRDDKGNLLYEIHRHEPGLSGGKKSFTAWEPLEGGGMGNGLNPLTPRVPFRLPELLAAPRQPVLVVEGEKCVIALAALGLVATCNAFGAGKWGADMGRWLRGRRVAVLPDNDEPGRAHAWLVLGNLVQWGAASVRLVHLPGLPDKGDVADWLADAAPGITPEQKKQALIDYIKGSPEWRPSSNAA